MPAGVTHGFTGQTKDSATGLIYMHARYYDPLTGQFISPDTIVPQPDTLLAYNRYLYAYANPLQFSDPTGHCMILADGTPDILNDAECWDKADEIDVHLSKIRKSWNEFYKDHPKATREEVQQFAELLDQEYRDIIVMP